MKINKKRIAIIIPNLSGGGAERTASKLSLYLPKDKYEKYIIIFDAINMEYDYDGQLINLDLRPSRNFIGKFLTFVKRIKKLKKIKEKYQFQTSISFLDAANIVNVLSKSKEKIILSIRNYKSKSSNYFYGKIHNYLIKMFYKYADIIIAVSQGVKEDLVRNYNINKNKIKVIYNFYDINEIKKMSTHDIEDEYKEIFNFPVIINMGRLTKQKGQSFLIKTFKNIKEVMPKMKLVFLGEGELENELKKLVYDLKLEKDVFFLGFQKNPFKFISKANIFVFSSLYEGFPNALVEAMSCGIPVISSDCDSGPREILAPGTNFIFRTKEIEYCKYGVLVPACNAKYLDRTIQLSNEEKLLGKSMLNMLCSNELLEKYRKKSLDRAADFKVMRLISEYEKIIN